VAASFMGECHCVEGTMSHEKSHDTFKYESRMASEDAAGFLESLAAGLRQHEVRLESGHESVSLRVADEVSFECSAKENPETEHGRFTLTVEWRATSHERNGTSRGMRITSGSMDHEEAESAHPSAPVFVVKVPDGAAKKTSSRLPATRSTAARTRTPKPKVASRKRTAVRPTTKSR
jgi:amphi-Trp domain-containing protein